MEYIFKSTKAVHIVLTAVQVARLPKDIGARTTISIDNIVHQLGAVVVLPHENKILLIERIH